MGKVKYAKNANFSSKNCDFLDEDECDHKTFLGAQQP